MATTGSHQRPDRERPGWLRRNAIFIALGTVGVVALSFLAVTLRSPASPAADALAGGPPTVSPNRSASVEPGVSTDPVIDPSTGLPVPTAPGGTQPGSPPGPTASSRPPNPPPANNPPPPPSIVGFPNASNTGVPAGWQPKETRGGWKITTPGVYEDVRVVAGDITVAADNVTLRRIEVVGGAVSVGRSNGCYAGLLIEDSTFLPPPGAATGGATGGVIGPGGYTVRRVKVENRIEGLRSGGCGPVVVLDSYIQIDDGGDCALHADGIQGYGGRGLVVRNVAIDAREMECGTAPLFYPRNQGNQTPLEIDGLWLAGGGYSLRLGVGPATVRGVKILDRSWGYGPVDVYCSAVQTWDVVVVDGAGKAVRTVSCTGAGN